MPLGFLIIGAIVLIAAFRNTHKQLGAQLAQDFSGSGNFVYWVIALAIIGGLGYIPTLRAPTRMLLVLLVVVLLLSNSGFWSKLYQAFQNAAPLYPTAAGGLSAQPATTTGAVPGEPPAPGPIPVQVSLSGAGSSNPLSGAAGIAGSTNTIVSAGSNLLGFFA